MESPYEQVRRAFPGVVGNFVRCPAYGEATDCAEDSEVGLVVLHLNDAHMWSRERIADWLETLNVDLSIRVSEWR